MIRVHATTLNSHGQHIHPVCRYALETLVYLMPDRFESASLTDCDCVFTNAPAAPPYSLDVIAATHIRKLNKPIFIFNDADGYMPDCEGDSPDKVNNFQNFVRYTDGIRGYFYREHHTGYARPDLHFPLIPFDLVGYLWTQHPKDKADYTKGITRESFLTRKWDLMFSQSLNCKSRIALYEALATFPRCNREDLWKVGKKPAVAWMNDLLQAKMATALEGAGIKTVAQCEVPMCSVMVLHDIPMEYAYPWIDGVNCIRLPYDRNCGEGTFIHNEGRGKVNGVNAVDKLKQLLEHPELLWAIFQAGLENARKYSLENYWKEHVAANIERLL